MRSGPYGAEWILASSRELKLSKTKPKPRMIHLRTFQCHRRADSDEITKIMGFWLELGVSGFRMDAVPFLIEKKGPNVAHQQDYGLLKEMRDFLQWRRRDAVLLAEANVPPDESLEYFGELGDRLLEVEIIEIHVTRRRRPRPQPPQNGAR